MKLYAIPTTHCNLNCNHCYIKNSPETYNREKFIEVLNSFIGEIILFGGEPTIYKDRMFDVINDNLSSINSLIGSISTNLMILDDDLITLYKRIKYVSTSWNPTRFKPDEYQTWLSNCKRLSDNDIRYIIMVTLTDDLLSLTPREFLDITLAWKTPNVKLIKFEHYVGDTGPEYFTNVDAWLCKLYKEWDSPIKFEMIDRVSCWNFNCNEVYTLFPDGTIVNSCPHNIKAIVPSECLTCERANECRPCKLQPYCSYPKQLAKLINEEVIEQ